MDTVNAQQAKANFDAILDRVAAGEAIVITRRGKAVGRMIPEKSASPESVREAVRSLRELRKRMASRKGYKPLTDAEIRSAINEGRR